MLAITRSLACGVVAMGLCGALASVGQAAGAIAVGACAAYGYAVDYGLTDQARSAALAKCRGGRCKVVGVMQHACGAVAIDGHNACGPHGYAVARRLGQAENLALEYCYKFGGRDCVIRAFACDAKG